MNPSAYFVHGLTDSVRERNAVIFLGMNIIPAAGPKAIKKYQIPEHGVLELNVPTSWTIEVHQTQKDMSLTIIFKPAKETDFQVLITVLWNKTGEQDFHTPDKIKTFIENDGQNILPKAVETKLVVQQIRGVNSIGYYYSLTDKTPKPGEYRYITREGIGVGDLLLNFTPSTGRKNLNP